MNNQPLDLKTLSEEQLQGLFSQTAFTNQINQFNLNVITQELLRRESLANKPVEQPIKLPKLNKSSPESLPAPRFTKNYGESNVVTGSSFALGNE